MHEVLEPGTPSQRALLDLIGAIASAGLACNVKRSEALYAGRCYVPLW